MIVIYHDIGGTHSSATAANIHINRLPIDRVPDKSDLLNLPTFDKITPSDYGHLMYIGEDEFGNSVYTISRQFNPELAINPIRDLYKILNGSEKGLYLINTSPTVNILMGIGGYSSRRLNLVSFGRPIATYGTLKAYPTIAKLVKETKERIRMDMEAHKTLSS